MSNDCLFCNLLTAGKLNLVYEDDKVVAFPDIDPKAATHILIIPREHIDSVNMSTEEHEAVLGHLFTVAKTIAAEKRISESGYRLVVNTGPHAGQSVFHVHMHLLGGQPLGHSNSDHSWE